MACLVDALSLGNAVMLLMARMRTSIRRAAIRIKAELQAVTLLEFLLSAACVVIVNRSLGIW